MAKRRGNNEGTITRRKDGRWEARYTAHTADGPKRKTIYGKTRQEVAEKLTKAMADRDRGLVFDSEDLTVGEYLNRWLTDTVRGTVRESTYEANTWAVKTHLEPAFGKVKLTKLTPAHVQGFYRSKLDAGLSPSTVHKLHTVLHKALKQAVRWNMIPRNVTEAVTPPRPAAEEMKPLSREETQKLLEAARGDRLEALYILAVHTGMRLGELLGLGWEDVKLDSRRLQLRRGLTLSGNRLVLGELKTKRSRRTVHLTERATTALRDHRKLQLEERIQYDGLCEDHGLVFTTHTGTPINPSNVRRRSLYPLLERAELPKIRFHDLRHTCATLLLSEGVHPKYVQELLGHANISQTLDTYSHVLPGMGEQTAIAMENALL